jgi:hypothetical protein
MAKDEKEILESPAETSVDNQIDTVSEQAEKIIDALSKPGDENILPELVEKDPEAVVDLAERKKKIREALDGRAEKVTGREITDPIQRNIELATEVDNLEAGKEFDRMALGSILERRMWGGIFNNLQKGDRIVSVLVPGDKKLAIKYLNDEVFGTQVTNKIIEQKRKVLAARIAEVDPQVLVVQSDYQTELIDLTEDSIIDNAKLYDIMVKVDDEMTQFITELTDDLIAEEKDNGRVKILKDFLDHLHGRSEHGKKGFRMNYGIATVEGDEARDQLLALNHSLQTSRMAREAKDGSYGAEYSEASNLQEVESIKKLRQEILSKGKIIDKDGNEFEIFSKKDNKFVLNKDLLRAVRKGKFETDNKELLDSISLYIKKLNLLDAVKPFIQKELAGAKESAARNKELAVKIKKGEVLNDEERKQAVDILRANEKNEKGAEFTSNSEFHKRAMGMNDAAYVSLDVLDLGVDQLLEYESALQDVEMAAEDKKAEKFTEVSLAAGDATTEKLRDFRKKVAQVCKEFGLAEGLIVGEIGGDELTLAVDMGEGSKLQEEGKMEEFLFALKEATNTRVIKTAVSRAEKHVDDEASLQDKRDAHAEAMKRAEQGAAIAKDVEEACRKLTLLLKREGVKAVYKKLDGLKKIFTVGTKEVAASVVIMESDKEFKIANVHKTDKDSSDFTYTNVKRQLDKILGREGVEKDPDPVSAITAAVDEEDELVRRAA